MIRADWIRAGDVIIRNGKQLMIKTTDVLNVTRTIYEFTAIDKDGKNVLFFARWNKEFTRVEAS